LLTSYLSELCEKEQVQIEPAALPLVVRAGAGSARDTLSVLDQLMGGAGSDGITYAMASALLGYTPDTLLDEVVDAFAAGDGSAVFGVIDKVIETGQDPRRFAEDLLRRLRDLVIVSAVPDAPATGLIDIGEDAADRLVAQAARFGPADLSRAADLVATGLTEMRGATAPRLLLELICARVLLPGADHSTEGVMARLDRLERRLTITAGDPSAAPSAPAEPASAVPPPSVVEPSVVEPSAREPGRQASAEPAVAADTGVPETLPEPVSAAPEPAAPAPTATTSAGSALTLVDVRRLWPDIVEATKQRRRLTWIYLTQQAQVVAVDDKTLTLGFANAGARDSFDGGGSAEIVRQAAIDVVGHDWRVETIVDPGAQPEAAPPPSAPVPASTTAPAQTAGHQLGSPPAAEPGTSVDPEATSAQPAPAGPAPAGPASADPKQAADQDGGARHDDTDAESSGLDGAQLLQETLGAQVIDEIPHQ
jgi:DNA polymerase-3 subunit gamma/tau